jgi:hypothetical protein
MLVFVGCKDVKDCCSDNFDEFYECYIGLSLYNRDNEMNTSVEIYEKACHLAIPSESVCTENSNCTEAIAPEGLGDYKNATALVANYSLAGNMNATPKPRTYNFTMTIPAGECGFPVNYMLAEKYWKEANSTLRKANSYKYGLVNRGMITLESDLINNLYCNYLEECKKSYERYYPIYNGTKIIYFEKRLDIDDSGCTSRNFTFVFCDFEEDCLEAVR